MPDYYLLNSDGTTYTKIDIGAIRTNEKLVPESDLLTVKGSSETNTKRLEAELDAAKKRGDELLTRVTTAESALTEREKELEPLKATSSRVEGLEAELNALKEKHSAAETQLLTTRRSALITRLKLEGDKKTQVESMNMDELASFEKFADIIPAPTSNGNQQPNQNFDRGNGGPPITTGSAFDNIKGGLAELSA